MLVTMDNDSFWNNLGEARREKDVDSSEKKTRLLH